MINYIKAELYRNFNRAYLWVYTGVIAALILLVNVIFSSNSSMNLTKLIQMTDKMMFLPVFLVVGMIDVVIAEENKNKTMKNVIAFGIERSKLILSKFIVAVVLAFISAAIILVVLYGSGALLLQTGNNFDVVFLDNLKRIGGALPLWMAAIAVGFLLNIVITNSNVCAFIYTMVFLTTSLIIKFLTAFVSDKFKYIYDILISTQLSNLSADVVKKHDITLAVIIGFIYIVVCLALSILCFKKREVK